MSEVTVIVTTTQHTYPINIIADASKKSLDYGKYVLPFIKGNQLLIVTNETGAPLYLEKLIESIQSQQDQLLNSLESSASITVKTCILPDGEQYKIQSSIDRIYDVLLENHFSRDSTLLALGGGVIGDMTGFAAASYMRGVNFIQVPTTLLAQVDSSVGGKTGINHRLGKNMIGAFWQPELVIADMTTLETLPTTELSAGLAEVVKYALIMDNNFLVWLEENIDGIMQLDYHLLSYVVKKCCELKAQIVSEDEREAGKRALLNFGHTFGHVIETHEGYGTFLHGEAVAIGMVQAAQLSAKLGWITTQDVDRIMTLLERCNLPITPPIIPVDEALSLMSHDKKSLSGQVRLILLKGLGNAVLTKNFCHDKLKEVLNNN